MKGLDGQTQSLTGLAFHVQTFGCQMNKHDSERVVGMLENLGAYSVDTVEESDVVVFMTCCVREAADVRLYGQVASMKNVPLRKDSPLPKRIVAVGGCIGQRDGDSMFETLPHLDVVFGTNNLASLPGLLLDALAKGGHHAETIDESTLFPSDLPTVREHNWAAWLPITIGCNNFCTYCIVPYVRGREKSRSFEEIVDEARRYVSAGVKEITLLGQNVNSYGRDLYGKPRFADILEAVADTGIERLRFATSHPKDLTDEVISKFGTLDALMPALHLPAQSGSNSILRAMNRSYTVEHYRSLIDKLREACPGISLSTDIIVGFPGETEDDFMGTYHLVEDVGYSQVFTFIYSKRSGTPAAELVDDTPRSVIQERFDRLRTVVEAGAYSFNQAQRGKTVEVLVEGSSRKEPGVFTGRSPENITVHAPLPDGATITDIAGKTVPVVIDEARTWYLRGSIAREACDA